MKTTRPLRSFLLRAWLALFGSAALSLHAANYTVTNTADSGAGSLRQAITDANANPGADTIDFSALFNTPQTITLGGTQLPAITDDLTVTGPAVGVTISGNNLNRVLDIGDFPRNLHPTVALVRLSIADGNAVGNNGGGIRCDGTLTMTDCTVRDNTAAADGGGIYAYESNDLMPATVWLTNCTFSGNSAGRGGGLFGKTTVLNLINCTASGNSSSSNSGIGGAGLFLFSGTVTLKHCTVSGNTANSGSGGGGLLKNALANLTLQNVLLAGNSADFGPDIYNNGGTIAASYSLIGNNSSSGIANGSNGNLAGNNASPINPLIGPLAGNGGLTQTRALLPGSPAINAGDPNFAGPPNTDQRGSGFPRVQFGRIDIGAYEYNAPLVPSLIVTTTADEDNGNSDPAFGTGTSLREAINYANAHPGADTITFDPTVFATPQTITLGGTPLPAIAENLTVTGPAAGVTISGNDQSAVLRIGSRFVPPVVVLSSLTITHGVSDFGGGIFNYQGTLTLANCTLSANAATNAGGGLYNINGVVTLINSTVSGNTAGTDGGSIENDGSGTLTLRHCTITANHSGGGGTGGGIRENAAGTTLLNTIMAGNFRGPGTTTADDINGAVTANYSLIGTTAGTAFNGGSGNNLTGVNPNLGPLANNGGATKTHALLAGSPAYNAGDPNFAGPPNTDQRGSGYPRVQFGRIDIGAYESATQLVNSTALAAWRQLQGLPANGSQDLANPSGDGVSNLLKFAFNMVPNAGDLSHPNVSVLPEDGTAGLPRIYRDSFGQLVIEFVARYPVNESGIYYTVETGDNLNNLQSLDLSEATITFIDANWVRASVTDPTVTSKRFGRVRVTTSP